MNIKEPSFFIALAGCLIAPWFIVGLTYWGVMFAVIVGIVALFEGIAVLRTKKTISQQFWKYSKDIVFS
jgi:ABC-type transporter Mla maintaining outer membrane lipid asymmetry permease subunit MlaE